MYHLILILPVVGLLVFWQWPLSLALPVYVVILLLSAWGYYYTVAAVRRKVAVGPDTLLRSRGRVLAQYGLRASVRVQGEVWNAISHERLEPGDTVEVVGSEGHTLRVVRSE